MMCFFISVNERAKRIKQSIQRMPLVGSDLVKQAVQAFHCLIVFAFVPNGEYPANARPVIL